MVWLLRQTNKSSVERTFFPCLWHADKFTQNWFGFYRSKPLAIRRTDLFRGRISIPLTGNTEVISSPVGLVPRNALVVLDPRCTASSFGLYALWCRFAPPNGGN